MNRVVLQFWEESCRGKNPIPDGCSIHLSSEDRKNYIDSIYKERIGCEVPDEYDRIVGSEIESFIDDALYEILKKEKSIRLYQHQYSNLINMNEIIIKETV